MQVLTNTKESKYMWWKHGIFYHIYTRSFYDSNNDGIGDLCGVIEKIDYLISIGVDAIWLSPIYQSPHIDFGYDVSDYRKIDSNYGTMDDFKVLIELCHSKGIKLIMDMVLNHTSDQHQWFKDSRSSLHSDKRDFYLWKKKKPNNWKSIFERTGWEYDSLTKEYYYHSFFKEQPDLNWRNPKVQKAMFAEIEFWLNLGVDGFRLDVINYIVKDKKFRNDPSLFMQWLFNRKTYSRNRNTSIKIISELRALVESYGEKVLIGEIYVLPPGNTSLVYRFLGKKNEALHLAFDFSMIFTSWSAKKTFATLSNVYKHFKNEGWPTFVYSNHDLKRAYSKPNRNKHRLDIAKLKLLLILTLKGTPFIYYGEEIGMENGNLSKKEIRDKLGKRLWPFYKGRDSARTPMQWNIDTYAGFSKHKPWLPVHKNYKSINVRVLQSDKSSIFNFYLSLVKLRKKIKLLHSGDIELISASNNVLIYKRKLVEEQLYILINFSNLIKKIGVYQNKKLLFSTHHFDTINPIEKKIFLEPYEGVILQS